jgi:hypothetical protein
MLNSYTHKLYTGVKRLCDTLKITLKVASYLTIRLRSMLVGEPLRRIARKRCLVLLAGLLLFTNMPNATAVSTTRDKNNYKIYAHMKIQSAKQYRCLETLWDKESRWDPRADNPKSTAYGIPQLLKLKIKDPYLQIDRGLKYIKHRHSNSCKALEFHKRNGYY